MHFKNQEDYKVWADQQEKGAIGGGIFTPNGPKDYVEAKKGYSRFIKLAETKKFHPSKRYEYSIE